MHPCLPYSVGMVTLHLQVSKSPLDGAGMDEALPILQPWEGNAQLQLPGHDSPVPAVGTNRDPQHLPPWVCQPTGSSTDGWLLGGKKSAFLQWLSGSQLPSM